MAFRMSAPAAALMVIMAAASAEADIDIGMAAPLTGHYAWSAEHVVQGASLAIENINARGGVLGQTLRPLLVDDYCDPEQAVAAARRLIAAEVPVVVGHQCSGAALPASEEYERAGIILISPAATNPRVTERGLRTVFRVCGRDDEQGNMAGELLVERWGDRRIAIVHDGQAYGAGLAQETQRRLNELGVEEAMFESVAPGSTDFSELIARLLAAEIDVLSFGGYQHEAGLIVRQAREQLGRIEFVMPDGIAGEDFWLIAGEAAQGILMSALAEARTRPSAAAVVEEFRGGRSFEPLGSTLYAYAAVQAWAQAAEEAGTTDPEAVIPALRSGQFDTVLGTLGFDERGDVTGIRSFDWFVWSDGEYVPLEEAQTTE
jgi:branched-chain amino acid transport system substrate-binding protein